MRTLFLLSLLASLINLRPSVAAAEAEPGNVSRAIKELTAGEMRADFDLMRRLLREAVVFDGRNLYEPKTLTHHGFKYYAIGLQT